MTLEGAAPPARRPSVVLGVAGGIAAYKAVEVLRQLTETGHAVRVVPTDAALRFVGEPTWAALSGQPVATDVWTDAAEVAHVQLGRQAELVLVAPATADLLARAATGRSDDLLTATLLTARCPVVFAPAMHTEMWEHPATRANVATLRDRGCIVIDPAVGRLTGADSGPGRLPDPAEIAALARCVLARFLPARSLPADSELGGGGDNGGGSGYSGSGYSSAATGWFADLSGRRILISAGGTREHLDPVRFLGNSSSGRQGYALARAALARGAQVVVVAANVALPDVAGARIVRVGSTAELRSAVHAEAAEADVVMMAAAVADFRPAVQAAYKIKKTDGDPEPIALVRNPDVLTELVAARRPDQLLVGFAAETGGPAGDVLALGREKLKRKGADLLVVNEVGAGLGFEVDDNAAVVLGADGSETVIERTAKDLLAHRVLDLVVTRLAGNDGPVIGVVAGSRR